MTDSLRDDLTSVLDDADIPVDVDNDDITDAEGHFNADAPPSEPKSDPVSDDDADALDDSTAPEDQPPKDKPPTEKAPVEKTLGAKAPASWTPSQREQWSKVPPELQKQIITREKEIADNLTNTSASRNVHERMSKLGESYAPIMAAEGVTDPVQAAEGLFQTVSQLRMGNAKQKAETIAGLINHYGVDVGTLDNVLVGSGDTASQVSKPQTEVERMLDEKMQPFNHMMQLLSKQQDTAKTQQRETAQKSVETFAEQAEFLGDVRNDMADLIDLAHSRGQEMSLQEAYDKAVAINPEISKVMEQRKLMEGSNNLAAKRNAATSLNGKRSGLTAPPAMGSSRRDDLMLAIDALSGR